MKLAVNFEIFDLNDKSLPYLASKYITDMLMDYKGDPLKIYELAININKNESIEIDTTDLKLVEDAIKDNPRYTNLIKGSILKEIEEQKTIATKEKKKLDK